MKSRVLWLAVPAIALYALVFIVPVLASIGISFFHWSGFSGAMRFVGVNNYAALAQDPQLIASLENNIVLMVLGGVATLGISLMFTFVLWRSRHQAIIRALLFFPSVVPPIALAIMWAFLYNYQFGLINAIFTGFGLPAVDWTGPNTIFLAGVAALIWINVGFYTVILLAGTSKIPDHVIDAAKVDGANSLTTFSRVVLPMIRDVATIAVALWVVTSVKTFDFLFALGGASQPAQPLWTLGIYQYILAFGTRDLPVSNLGYAEAVAVVMIALVAVGFGLVNVVLRRGERVEY